MMCILPSEESDEVKRRRDAFYVSCVRELLTMALERDDHYARTVADVLLSASGYEYAPNIPWRVNLKELSKFGNTTRGQLTMVLNGAVHGTRPAFMIQGGDQLFAKLRYRWHNPERQ